LAPSYQTFGFSRYSTFTVTPSMPYVPGDGTPCEKTIRSCGLLESMSKE